MSLWSLSLEMIMVMVCGVCVRVLWSECLPRMGETWLLCFPQLEEVQTHIFSLLSVPNHKAMGKCVAYSSLNDVGWFFKRKELESWWSRDVKGGKHASVAYCSGYLDSRVKREFRVPVQRNVYDFYCHWFKCANRHCSRDIPSWVNFLTTSHFMWVFCKHHLKSQWQSRGPGSFF